MIAALTSFHLAVLFIASTFLVAAAVSDAVFFRIPNQLCFLLVLLFPVFVATAPRSVLWKENVVVSVIVFGIGFLAFLRGMVGAGDVKLLSAASLWAGPEVVAALFLVMAVVGGVQALVTVLALRYKTLKSEEGGFSLKTQIPYGVAIAAGGVVALWLLARPVLMLY